MSYTIGYYQGVLDVYYALMSTEDTASSAASYGTPAVLGKSIEVTITPRYLEGSMYASNSRVRNENRLDGYDVTLNLDQIAAAARRAVLGHSADAKGVEVLGQDTAAPYVAIGFARTKDNDTKEYWWIYKGKFREMEGNAQTMEDGIEYQTPTLEGSFDRRMNDGRVAAVLDTEASDADATTASTWFSAVYEYTAPTTTP